MYILFIFFLIFIHYTFLFSCSLKRINRNFRSSKKKILIIIQVGFELSNKNVESWILTSLLLSRFVRKEIYPTINCNVNFATYFLRTLWVLRFNSVICLYINYTVSIRKRSSDYVTQNSNPLFVINVFEQNAQAIYSFYFFPEVFKIKICSMLLFIIWT